MLGTFLIIYATQEAYFIFTTSDLVNGQFIHVFPNKSLSG